MNEQLKNRLKSFCWRVGMMVMAALIDSILASLDILELRPPWTVVLGLFLGELSKYLNRK